jgi:very-short-patch-repair endonuclease
MFICWIAVYISQLFVSEEFGQYVGLWINKRQPIRKISKEDEKEIFGKKRILRNPKKGNSFKDKCPEKAKYWSKKNIFNGKYYSPDRVCANSHHKFIFECMSCNHEFIGNLNSMTKLDSWCNYCSHDNLCDHDDCYFCYINSFASHERSKEWNYEKNKKVPRQVFLKTNKEKYWFVCNNCKHDYKNFPVNITGDKQYICAYCTGHRLCHKDCKMCYEHSFESHPRSKNWSKKNKKSPRDVFKHSHDKYIFDCDECLNEFSSRPHDIISKGSWCPVCKNKTEYTLFIWLKETYGEVIKEMKFEWCKNILCLPFDFYIPSLNLIIELDGIQHFEYVKLWDNNPEEIRKRDKEKEDLAKLHGISVIRIFQEDVFYNRTDWKSALKETIKKYDVPTVIKIGKIYEKFP